MSMIGKFSDVVMIGTINLLYKKELISELNMLLNAKVDSILKKLGY